MYIKVKRIIDILLALLGLFLVLPLFIILIPAIKIDSKGPIFFKQKRVGLHKSYFYIYKFRTMRIDTPSEMPTHMLSDAEQHITRLGRILRKTSLDEIPQLWNILKGDMSFVGPRPALWNQYDLISERDKYTGRFNLTPNNIRPGLTGWAQINGRDEITILDKAKLDGDYIRSLGCKLDLRCFLYTIICVLQRRGISEGIKRKAEYEYSAPESYIMKAHQAE